MVAWNRAWHHRSYRLFVDLPASLYVLVFGVTKPMGGEQRREILAKDVKAYVHRMPAVVTEK